MKYTDAIVLVFSKAPVAGEVNTRLTPFISHDEAADLQRELVHNRLEMLEASSLCRYQLWCAPDTQHPFFKDCADIYGIDLKTQTGIDLGERMLNASRTMLESYSKVIIIGTDAPALGVDQLEQAISELDHHDAVLVPAEDGGYVLLGARVQHDEMLKGVPWGTEKVLASTLDNMARLNIDCALVGKSWDVHRPEDFERYRRLKCGVSDLI